MAVSELFSMFYQYLLGLLKADSVAFRNTEVPFYFFSVGVVSFLLFGVGCMIFFALCDMARRRRNAKKLGMSFSLFWEVTGLITVVTAFSFFLLGYSQPYGIIDGKRPVYKDEAVDFIFDLTPSQKARDIIDCRMEKTKNGDVVQVCVPIARIDAVKAEATYAVNRLVKEGVSYFCIGYFTGTKYLNRLIECTDSTESILDMLGRLDVAFAGEAGTNLTGAFGEDYTFVKSILPKETRITAVVITDGGREVACGNQMAPEESKDWNEKELEDRVRELTAKQSIRIIPVGVGSQKWVPVPTTDSNGREDFIRNKKGEILCTKLDEGVIERMALWSGDKDRHFILREGKSLGDWLVLQALSGRRVDHYVPAEEYAEYWIYPVAAAVLLGSLYLGVLGFIGRLASWFLRRED